MCLSISAVAWGMCIVYMAKYFCRETCYECKARAREEYKQAPSWERERALYRCCIHEEAHYKLMIRLSYQYELISACRHTASVLLRFEVRRRLDVTLQEHIEGFVQQDVNDMLE